MHPAKRSPASAAGTRWTPALHSILKATNIFTPALAWCSDTPRPRDIGAPFREWKLADGTLWTQFFRITAGYVLRFPGLADFTVSRDGQSIVVYPEPKVTPATIEHLYLNQVLPLALSRQFKLVLHASAIEIEDFAVAFLGTSGAGKSTLAASFAAGGYRFLSDDGLQLQKCPSGYSVSASHPSIRLWKDSHDALLPETVVSAPPVSYTSKLRLLADRDVTHCPEERILRCGYFLTENEANDISIEPMSARDAMIGLVKNCFLLDVEARDMLAHHFRQLSELVQFPIFFRLDFPRRYASLPEVRQAIIRHSALFSVSGDHGLNTLF